MIKAHKERTYKGVVLNTTYDENEFAMDTPE